VLIGISFKVLLVKDKKKLTFKEIGTLFKQTHLSLSTHPPE